MSLTSTAAGTARQLGRLAVNLTLVATILVAAAWVIPSFLGYERYVLTGGSMSGTYEKGSVVFDRLVPVDELRVGDVISYVPPPDTGVNHLVTHRIVKMTPGRNGTVLRTRGDANEGTDPWTFSLVDEQQPVVDFAVPHVGYAMIALADRDTRMLLVGVPAGLVALIALKELVAALRRPAPRPVDAPPTSSAALA